MLHFVLIGNDADSLIFIKALSQQPSGDGGGGDGDDDDDDM
jgi:hypothetical protein